MMTSSLISGEDSSWAQTFVTVTPQDDGFLREIKEDVVVSGDADTPLNLDTWNVVLRRSLIDTTKAWIDPNELEESTRVATECQTYLQGFPKVELPLVYRDEATQTLYMGHDAAASATPDAYFDDIITVLNDKPLPQMRTTRAIQTSISTTVASKESEVIKMLRSDETISEESSSTSLESISKSLALMEAEDVVNFIIARTEWQTKSHEKKEETKDEESQTLFTYNWRSKALMSAFGTQTQLSCKPRDSNSKLLTDYNETKNFCRDRVNECLEKGVYPIINVENIVEEIMEKCRKQVDFPFKEETEKIPETSSQTRSWPRVMDLEKRVCLNRTQKREKRITRYACVGQEDVSSESSGQTECTESSVTSSDTNSEQTTSSSETSLNCADKRALKILRNAFYCNRDC